MPILPILDLTDVLDLFEDQDPVDLIKGAPSLLVIVELYNFSFEFDALDDALLLPKLAKQTNNIINPFH